MKNQISKLPLIPKQSDITIDPNGNVFVSFLWKDIIDDKLEANTKVNFLSYEEKLFLTNEEKQKDLLQNYENCNLCPKKCNFNRLIHSHPNCGNSDMEIGTYGISFGDEDFIKGINGSGTILFSHCPMNCPSCHNPEMVSQGTKINLAQLAEICFRLQNQNAENIQFLSPTIHYPKLILLLKFLKSKNFKLPIILKSSGNETIEMIKALKGLVDIYLPDFKYGPNSEFAKRAGSPNYYYEAIECIDEMIKQVGNPVVDSRGVLQKGVLIRHVKAPIPEIERESIMNYLKLVKNKSLYSINDNFVNLE